jgi:predicted nucleic acid-binding protein
MTLVDTSAWIEHLRRPDSDLMARLEEGTAACHPFVIGEMALGSLRRRAEILELLQDLPGLDVVTDRAVLGFVERHRLAATGIGWVDAHLLASAEVAGAVLLTRDRRLRLQADRLGLLAS